MGQYYPFFKAYDVRARVPDELDADLARRIGRAYAAEIGARTVVVGRDMRLSSAELADALIEGLTAGGADVLDIGLCGTEEVYYVTFSQATDGGIMVTASHNPKDYNGLKFVREGARPISSDTGLFDIEKRTHDNDFPTPARTGERRALDHRPGYIDFLLGQIRPENLRPLRIVANPGNGCAGLIVDPLSERLPLEIVRLHFEPDGELPNGIPNPLLPENREATAAAVREHGADFGVAWDGDFDRCFFFDENGEFIEGYYIVGLIAQMLLAMNPGEAIVHDPRLTWNTLAQVRENGGTPVQSKSGHSFMKQVMREADALYGGEMSAHHYFRDFSYADNGHIPWLVMAQLISESGKPLSTLVAERIAAYPASGEINREIGDPDAALADLERHYGAAAQSIEHVDGLSMDFGEWRFNVRRSNTEPVVRLNVETRGDIELMRAKTDELLARLAAG
ncbi:phosphomannomutase [Salinisphaera orenii]|uniref:phosphomannomutase n=1 Tax=Salinisphaera orenii YIM 95161 TaxID=1051139 RepID=A0A423PJC7_9GAMM|nr:phosphomannomutase [Salinisphaera halophila]ROO25704.1 phosphomannomutase [Salinisphaera halophila YIM 95161]